MYEAILSYLDTSFLKSLDVRIDSNWSPFHPDTWKKDVKVLNIEDAINSAAPEKLRVISVSEVLFCSWEKPVVVFIFHCLSLSDALILNQTGAGITYVPS